MFFQAWANHLTNVCATTSQIARRGPGSTLMAIPLGPQPSSDSSDLRWNDRIFVFFWGGGLVTCCLRGQPESLGTAGGFGNTNMLFPGLGQ